MKNYRLPRFQKFFSPLLSSVIPFLAILMMIGTLNPVFAGDKPADHYTVKIESIQQIFRLEKSSAVNLFVNDAEGKSHKWSGVVINHLNMGENSGAMSVQISSDAGNFKLLMSRKLLNGKLVYLLNLMEPGTKNAYKMTNEKDGSFILEKTDLEKIVTP